MQRGFDITRSQQRPGCFPVISSSGVSGFHDQAAVMGPGVAIGRKGSLGTVHYTEVDFWPHDTTLWVKDFHGNDPRFVYYFLKSLNLARLDVGSVNPTLNRNHVHPMPVNWPPLDEQHAIASILGALDDKIELNGRMNETLEAMARAIFESAVRGDGESDGAGPSRRVPLAAVAVLTRASVRPEQFPGEEFDHFSLPAFDYGRAPVIEAGSLIHSTKYAVPESSVLVSKLNPRIPRTWMPHLGHRRALASTEYLVLTPSRGVSREYLYCLCSSAEFTATIAGRVTGTSGSHQRVQPEDVFGLTVPKLDAGPMERFTRAARPVLELAEAKRRESRTLADARDALMPPLLGGEIRSEPAQVHQALDEVWQEARENLGGTGMVILPNGS